MPAFALLIWPFVSLVLFMVLGRTRGFIWSVVPGYLFLPEAWGFDLPALPPFGKRATIVVGIVLGLLVTRGKVEPLPDAQRAVKTVIGAIVLLLLLTPFVTMLTNQDGFAIGSKWFPPIRLREVFAALFTSGVLVAPFLIARRLLYTPEAHQELLKAIMIMGLIYVPLVLFELRMSPQLNNIVYGYFPHSWIQHIRGGAWRPLVFLSHGLELGFYLLTAVLAAVGYFRVIKGASRFPVFIGLILLFVVLAISHNLGALAICIFFLPVALFLAPRTHVKIAVVVSTLFMTYPFVRDAYITPLLNTAQVVSDERYRSLKFRFINEDLLVDHALERPVAGWGPWSRSRPHNEHGEDIVTVDGLWIIQLGVWGWMGFIGFFGLLMAPLLFVGRMVQDQPQGTATSVLTLMTAANFIYIIPNSTLSPVGWIVAGALAGYAQFGRNRTRAEHEEPDTPAPATGRCSRRSPYTRYGHRHTQSRPSARQI